MAIQTTLAKTTPQSLTQSERSVITPACDVYENKDEVLVLADLPGVKADGLTIAFERGELTLEGRREPLMEGIQLEVERRDADYRRRFAIPSGIDSTRISAELKQGVMHLHLPKSEALKPRTITVRGA